MRSRYILFLIFTAMTVFLLKPVAYAEKIISTEADNVFVLDNGQRVRLAGIEIPEESENLISVLLSSKDIKVRPDQMLMNSDAAADPQPVYLYVNTAELAFPFAEAMPKKRNKVVVNELLLAMGAAAVDDTLEFELKDHFLEIQAEAKTQGKGIWSYEEYAFKP